MRVLAGRVTMRKQQSFATILVGKKILLREGLAKILRSANFRILASVSCADDLLPGKLQLQQPLFLVVHTGDDFDVAIEQIELLREQYPGGRIAIVADHYRLGELVSAFRAGANGYFVDVITCDVFIKSMELVMMGETIFPPPFLSFVLGPEGDHLGEAVLRKEKNQAILITTEDMLAPQLSARENSILRCLIEGDSNKCIARKIGIAEATAKVQGDPSQDRGPKSDTGSDLGDEQWVIDTTGKRQFPGLNYGCEQAASTARRGDLRSQANRGIGTARRDRARCRSR
jgi:DNA-binding NarL/FixJ family response regulator